MNTHTPCLMATLAGMTEQGRGKKRWDLIEAIRTQDLWGKYSSLDLMALKVDFRFEFYFTKGLSRHRVYFVNGLSPKKVGLYMEMRVATKGMP